MSSRPPGFQSEFQDSLDHKVRLYLKITITVIIMAGKMAQ